jgi:hypothetical protein
MKPMMSELTKLLQIVRADFLGRTRRYSTLINLGVVGFLTYSYLPPADADYVTFSMNGYRGVYNSAWVGGTVTVFCVLTLSFGGFYLVKSAITLDRRTGVGQIIATTPLTKVQYVLAKMVSNWLYLAALAAVALLAAMAMQLVLGQVLRIEPWGYLAPYLLIILPALAWIAALAVLFESIHWLRGGLGNVLYFFLFVGGLSAMAFLTFLSPNASFGAEESARATLMDPTGSLIVFRSMILDGMEEGLGQARGFVLGRTFPELYGLPRGATFVYDGVSWTGLILLGRLMWVGAALVLAAVAAVFFDRFDPTREGLRVPQKGGRAQKEVSSQPEPSPTPGLLPAPATLTSLPATRRVRWPALLAQTVLSELRLMVKGSRWWWYVVAGGLSLAALVSPVDRTHQIWLPLAWIWPLLIWSPLGNRAARHRMEPIVLSAAYPLRNQIAAAWLAGLIVALATASGAVLCLLVAGQWSALLALSVGAAFVPALALVLGVWSRSSKLFEVVYLVLWYVGPMNGTLPLDYLGATDAAVANSTPLVYLLLTVLSLGLALLGSRRQLRS